MRKLIALTLALVSVSAFALNPNRTWHSRGETLKFVGYQTTLFKYDSKEAAVEGALDLIADLKSGNPSRSAMQKLNTAFQLWDSGEKCQSTTGMNARIVAQEMAKGNAEVISITVSSYFTGAGAEVFNSQVRFYAPCVMKDRD
ncbi:MAG: hypothetical protein EP326_06970 [Deltaproteobacteria bacterium]|nr:MAG: hypothetical protein EP326_06970 [Deltaproteobacteria bacterium]TNF26438.1 MAG: hypothetical protein EP319_13870 [Deltaproteobacteria bacterium]